MTFMREYNSQLKKKAKTLHFQDLKIKISGNKRTFEIYRKPTATDIAIHKNS